MYCCVCIELFPSNPTNAQRISSLAASVEAPCLHLHSPLLASKAVLSSWSLVVICDLIARERFKLELEVQAGTSSYITRTIYTIEYVWYVKLPGTHIYTYIKMYFFCPWLFFSLTAAGLSSCSRLRGSQGARPDPARKFGPWPRYVARVLEGQSDKSARGGIPST